MSFFRVTFRLSDHQFVCNLEEKYYGRQRKIHSKPALIFMVIFALLRKKREGYWPREWQLQGISASFAFLHNCSPFRSKRSLNTSKDADETRAEDAARSQGSPSKNNWIRRWNEGGRRTNFFTSTPAVLTERSIPDMRSLRSRRTQIEEAKPHVSEIMRSSYGWLRRW